MYIYIRYHKKITVIYFDDSDIRVYKLKIMKKISSNIKKEAQKILIIVFS